MYLLDTLCWRKNEPSRLCTYLVHEYILEDMKTTDEIRLENGRALMKEAGGPSSFAERVDRQATQISRLVGKNPSKPIGDRLARHFEDCFNKPKGWLDYDHSLISESNVDSYRVPSTSVPVLSWVQAGNWCEISDIEAVTDEYLAAPYGCSEGTFALRVRGQSMEPVYKHGVIIYVEPSIAPVDGDDVIAVLTESNEATFKQYIEEPGSGKYLKARNPSWPNPWIQINEKCHIIGVVTGYTWSRHRS